MKVFNLILLVGLILIISCTPKVPASSKNIFWPEYKGRALPQPVVIAVDENFNEEEEMLIAKAFKAWETASSNKVSFVVKWNTPEPGWYKDQIPLKENQGVFLWDLPRTYFHLTPEEKKKADQLWGLCVYGPGTNSAHVIIYEGIDKYKFYSVSLHEIGHLIGMFHTKGKNVMHPSAVSECITQYDAEQLCELYDCIPKPECHI